MRFEEEANDGNSESDDRCCQGGWGHAPVTSCERNEQRRAYQVSDIQAKKPSSNRSEMCAPIIDSFGSRSYECRRLQIENHRDAELRQKRGIGPFEITGSPIHPPNHEMIVKFDGDPQNMRPVTFLSNQRMRDSVKKSNDSEGDNECDTNGDVFEKGDAWLRSAAQRIGVQRPATALTGPTLPTQYAARRRPRSIEPSCCWSVCNGLLGGAYR